MCILRADNLKNEAGLFIDVEVMFRAVLIFAVERKYGFASAYVM